MLKIFLMTKNEKELLEDWIRYHGYLFGIENIHVLDGSDERSVLDIYPEYQSRGLNVHFSGAGLNDLAEELNRLMHEHKGSDNFLIKLDTDEFLAYTRPLLPDSGNPLHRFVQRRYLKLQMKAGGLRRKLYLKYMDRRHAYKTLHTENISRIFDALPVNGQKYKAALTAWSLPVREAPPRPCRSITQFTPLQFTHIKAFFHSSSFVSVDLGCHQGVTTRDHGFIATGLAVIHYHSTSLEDSVRRARQVLLSHGYIGEPDDRAEQRRKLAALQSDRGIASQHKIDLYLKHLDFLDGGEPIDLDVLNRQHPYFRQPGPGVELTLVRDTLHQIEVSGFYSPGNPAKPEIRG